MHVVMSHGKICYVELPANDEKRSAAFYEAVFGWRVRARGDGKLAFDDATGAVSGAFVSGRPPLREAGVLLYVMVDDAAATLKTIAANGGAVVQEIGTDPGVTTARF